MPGYANIRVLPTQKWFPTIYHFNRSNVINQIEQCFEIAIHLFEKNGKNTEKKSQNIGLRKKNVLKILKGVISTLRKKKFTMLLSLLIILSLRKTLHP